MKRMPSNQAGFVMVLAMMFMLALSLLAITAVRRVTLDEKFVNSIKAQNLAFQSAETALRFCEREFAKVSKGNPIDAGIAKTTGTPQIPINRSEDVTVLPTLWRTRANWASNGAKLPAGTVTNVYDQPECMIEEWSVPNKDFGLGVREPDNRGDSAPAYTKAYVFTARGQGTSATSVVWLQSVLYLGNGTLN